MKILICGSGSIATRHYQNLRILGYKNIIFYKSSNSKVLDKKIKKEKIYHNLKKALDEKPDIAFICNITSLHVDVAIECAKKKCHLFVEKPISNSLKKIKILKKIIKEKNLFFLVGYMMRFHPLIIKIKKIIEKENNIFYASSIWGEYLPKWHPNENYSNSYAAVKKLGGGVSLTLSHDLDTMFYLFGKINKLFNLRNFKSSLKTKNIDVSSTYLIKFNSGIDCNIHINYLCNPPVRELRIFGEKIQIYFNYYKSKLEIKKNNKIKKYVLKNFKRNNMFIEEIKYFFKKLKSFNNLKLNDDFYILKYLV